VRSVAHVRQLVQQRADDGAVAPPARAVAVGRAADRDDGRRAATPDTSPIRPPQAQTGFEPKIERHALEDEDGLQCCPQLRQQQPLCRRRGRSNQADAAVAGAIAVGCLGSYRASSAPPGILKAVRSPQRTSAMSRVNSTPLPFKASTVA